MVLADFGCSKTRGKPRSAHLTCGAGMTPRNTGDSGGDSSSCRTPARCLLFSPQICCTSFCSTSPEGSERGSLGLWKLGSKLLQVVQGLHPFLGCQRASIQALMLKKMGSAELYPTDLRLSLPNVSTIRTEDVLCLLEGDLVGVFSASGTHTLVIVFPLLPMPASSGSLITAWHGGQPWQHGDRFVIQNLVGHFLFHLAGEHQ